MSVKTQIIILGILCICCFFLNRDKISPDIMESRNYITAQEMIEYDNWMLPTLNGEPRLAKPPLPTWITAGWALLAGDRRDNSLLRIPAAVVATLMVFALFFLAREFTKDPLIPFLSAAILATCFYFNYIGRINTWDIYCHSFMLIAIWLAARSLNSEKINWFSFTWIGVLLGLSFLSKGPVSFYTVLLPFIISFPFFYGFSKIKNAKWATLYALILCLAIGLTWPIYTYIFQKEIFTDVLLKETAAWADHRSRPFYHYWSFFIQTGIWALIVIFSFSYNYISRKIEDKKTYRFFFWWAVITLILLSSVPEKKERYLLPAFIPISVMAGVYLRYLMVAFRQSIETKWDRFTFGFHSIVLGLVSLLLIPVHYALGFEREIYSMPVFVLLSLFALGISVVHYYFWRKRNVIGSIFASVSLMVLINLFSLPIIAKPVENQIFKPIHSFGDDPQYEGIPIFSEIELKPEYLWQIGERVKKLGDLVIADVTTCGPPLPEVHPIISSKEPNEHISAVHQQMGEKFIFISQQNPCFFLLRNYSNSSVELIDTYYPGSKKSYVFHAYLVFPNR